MKKNYIYIAIVFTIIIVSFLIINNKSDNKLGEDSDIVTDTPTTVKNSSTNIKNPIQIPVSKPSTTKSVPTGTPVATILEGSIYRLASYKGVDTPVDSKYTISFNNGSISTNICNNMSGNYSLDGVLLKVSNLVSTQMYCTVPTGIMDVETVLGTMLTFGVNMYVTTNKVTLVNSQGVIMVFSGFTR